MGIDDLDELLRLYEQVSAITEMPEVQVNALLSAIGELELEL